MSAKPASMCRIALCGSGELRILRFCCSCILCKSFTELISIYIFINSFFKSLPTCEDFSQGAKPLSSQLEIL